MKVLAVHKHVGSSLIRVQFIWVVIVRVCATAIWKIVFVARGMNLLYARTV
jgi:hypothetical protein